MCFPSCAVFSFSGYYKNTSALLENGRRRKFRRTNHLRHGEPALTTAGCPPSIALIRSLSSHQADRVGINEETRRQSRFGCRWVG